MQTSRPSNNTRGNIARGAGADARKPSERIDSWLNDLAANPTRGCQRPDCRGRAGQYNNYCDEHSCHECHQAPSVIGFENMQGFCSSCFREVARGRSLARTYPVVPLEQQPPPAPSGDGPGFPNVAGAEPWFAPSSSSGGGGGSGSGFPPEGKGAAPCVLTR